MHILTNDNVVFAHGETIERGIWENDLTTETYRIKNGDNHQYAVIADFGLHEVDSIPKDFEPNKYCYTEEQGFYINPDYEKYSNNIKYTLDEAAAIITSEVAGNE